MDYKLAAQKPYQGLLGSTSTQSISLRSDEGHMFAAQIYTAVNVTKNPELREPLVAGTLNSVQCPWSERQYALSTPVIYHNEDVRFFALIVPDSLRHREMVFRADLLQKLSQQHEFIPEYVANFVTVVSETGIDAAERRHIEQHQLAEVAERIERESVRMDEVMAQVSAERASLEQLHTQIERERASLRHERTTLELLKAAPGIQSGDKPHRAESTQVVTDDQFVDMLIDEEKSLASERANNGEFQTNSSEGGAEATEAVIEQDVAAWPEQTVVVAVEPHRAPGSIDEIVQSDIHPVMSRQGDELWALWQVEDAELQKWLHAEQVHFWLQYREVHGMAVIAFLFSVLDEDWQTKAALVSPLNIGNEAHQQLLEDFNERKVVHFALYGEDGRVAGAWRVTYPHMENLAWAQQWAEQYREECPAPENSFEDVISDMSEPGFDHLGGFRHNFHRDSFDDLDSPAKAQLASSIVGFWSTPEKLHYLIGRRGFPLRYFREIQLRVIRHAIDWGIYINEPLQHIAVEEGLAAHPLDLVAKLTANFAEVSVRIRPNDLDPMQQWDNWDALMHQSQSLDVTPQADIIELAEASLKRAQEFQEQAAQQTDAVFENRENGEQNLIEVDKPVVAKRSGTTGVTYFLPESGEHALYDELDENMTIEQLHQLSENKPEQRLELAQVVLERFGAEGLSTVTEIAEMMTASELAALSRYVAQHAPTLESELIAELDRGGVQARLMIVRALAYAKCSQVRSILVEALVETNSFLDMDTGEVITHLLTYEEEVLPVLQEHLDDATASNQHIIELLASLETNHPGLLARLLEEGKASTSIQTIVLAVRDKLSAVAVHG